MSVALGFVQGIAWETESPFLDVDYEVHNDLGVSSLKHLATKKLLSDQRNLELAHFRHVPWPIAEELWQYLCRSGKTTLYMWKIFCICYSEEFRRLSQRCEISVPSPKYPLSGYIKLVRDPNNSWATKLNLWTEFTRVPELVELAQVTNLVSLEVNTSISGIQSSSEPEDQEVVTLNDRIVRTWSELAESSDAFQHLQTLKLYRQRNLTAQSFAYLSRFPVLEYCVLAMCDFLSEKSAVKRAESYGWKVEDVSDPKIAQFNQFNQFTPHASLAGQQGKTTGQDQLDISSYGGRPVLEFTIGQRREMVRDREVIVLRRVRSRGTKGNKRNLVDVSTEQDRVQRKPRKPIMRERGKDLTNMLAEFS